MTKHAINNDKFEKMDSATYKSWGKRVHVEINAKRKTTTQEKNRSDSKVFNRYCTNSGCKNTADIKGEECKACYAKDFEKMRLGRSQYDIKISNEYTISDKVAF